MEGTFGSSSYPFSQVFFKITSRTRLRRSSSVRVPAGFCLVSLIIRCGVISEVHAGDGFQFWNIIDFHTLPCVNAKFYKFRNDSSIFPQECISKSTPSSWQRSTAFLICGLIRERHTSGEKNMLFWVPQSFMEHQNIPVCNIRLTFSMSLIFHSI